METPIMESTEEADKFEQERAALERFASISELRNYLAQNPMKMDILKEDETRILIRILHRKLKCALPDLILAHRSPLFLPAEGPVDPDSQEELERLDGLVDSFYRRAVDIKLDEAVKIERLYSRALTISKGVFDMWKRSDVCFQELFARCPVTNAEHRRVVRALCRFETLRRCVRWWNLDTVLRREQAGAAKEVTAWDWHMGLYPEAEIGQVRDTIRPVLAMLEEVPDRMGAERFDDADVLCGGIDHIYNCLTADSSAALKRALDERGKRALEEWRIFSLLNDEDDFQRTHFKVNSSRRWREREAGEEIVWCAMHKLAEGKPEVLRWLKQSGVALWDVQRWEQMVNTFEERHATGLFPPVSTSCGGEDVNEKHGAVDNERPGSEARQEEP